MTHTIELDRPIEQALEAKARRRGLGLDAYLRDLAERDAQSEPAQSEATPEAAAMECLTEHAAEGNGMEANGSINGAVVPTTTPPTATAQPIVFSTDRATRSAQLAALLYAPADVREATLAAGAAAMAAYAATPEGQAEWDELADWRALDGEDFHGFEDEDAEASENAEAAATAQQVAA